MTDPVADMFTRVLNASRAGRESVIIPHSKLKSEIARLLKERGFIKDIEKKGKKVRKFLELTLRYNGKFPALAGLVRVSKTSRRVYVKSGDIAKMRRGFGTLIISTSRGLMTGEEAAKQKLGGEAIGKVW